jgi:uncharacterized protein with HEPN domain
MKRDISLYVSDILENMDNAAHFVSGLTLDQIKSDRKTAYAVIRCFEIIGEAAKNVPQVTRDMYPAIPWRTMAGMRDKMIHAYFGIDYETVWKAVIENIPQIRPLIKSLLDELQRHGRK